MDDADRVDQALLVADAAIHAYRYEIPKGIAGDCDECGKASPRLIGGYCAPCRDKKKGRP